jgi:hypothetical protein
MKIRKIFLGLLLGCFGLWVLTAASISQFYFTSLPTAPDAKAGRIYQMVGGG